MIWFSLLWLSGETPAEIPRESACMYMYMCVLCVCTCVWLFLALLLLWIFLFFIFWDRVLLCHPGWSPVARSRLTATSASWVQAIFMPQPPKQLGLQAVPPWLANFCIFSRDRVSPRWPVWSQTPGLKLSARLGLPTCWDYKCESLHLANRIAYWLQLVVPISWLLTWDGN